MKKIISLILVLTIVLIMSGCGGDINKSVSDLKTLDGYENCSLIMERDNIFKEYKTMYVCDNDEFTSQEYMALNTYENIYYTQEEVDLMLLEQSNELLQLMIDNLVQYNEEDNAIYADCYIVDNLKHCDIVLDLDEDWALLTENQYTNLLQRIEELENQGGE